MFLTLLRLQRPTRGTDLDRPTVYSERSFWRDWYIALMVAIACVCLLRRQAPSLDARGPTALIHAASRSHVDNYRSAPHGRAKLLELQVTG